MADDNTSQDKIWAIIPAAGIGARMGSEIPKQYLSIGEKTVLEHSLSNFIKHPAIYKVVVAIHPDDERWSQLEVAKDPKVIAVEGGEERVDSVANALNKIVELGGTNDWVMVHDAARPCLYNLHIDNLITAKESSKDGVILTIPSYDTVKLVNSVQTVEKTLDRDSIWLAQTPQFFPVASLKENIESAKLQGFKVTDEASAMEAMGLHPALVIGSRKNIKITDQEDLLLASIFLAS